MHISREGRKIWITADLHYGHRSIVRALSTWGNKEETTRDFQTIAEMNDAIITRFNEVVGPNDILIILGDIAFGIHYLRELLQRLNCKNIYFLPGNHDKEIVKSKELQSHFAKYLLPLQDITIGEQHMVCSHFAMRVWNRSHFGSWNLYGHSHGSVPDPTDSKQMDVGIDTHNLYPYSFEEIEEIMSHKQYHGVGSEGRYHN